MDTLFIFQAVDLCNLNCKYCYLPGRKNPRRMSDEILESAVKKIFDWQSDHGGAVSINWNAGEPLAAKIDFYQNAVRLFEKYNVNGVCVNQTLQTNATLLTEEWAQFFKENNFFVTVSVDGPAFIHDRSRVNWRGRPTHELVQKGIDILRGTQPQLHAICVLPDYSLDFPDEIYSYFIENGFHSVGFNIEEHEGYNSVSPSFSSNCDIIKIAERYAQFLARIDDLTQRDGHVVKIREIETIRRKLTHYYHNSSVGPVNNQQNLPLQIVTIGKDGELFTFSPEMSGGTSSDPNAFVVGNVTQISTFSDILSNANFIKIYDEIKSGLRRCEANCEYFQICGGGAPMNKFSENGTFDSAETNYCILSQKTVANLFLKRWAAHATVQ